MKDSDIYIVSTITDDIHIAKKIARGLVERHLAESVEIGEIYKVEKALSRIFEGTQYKVIILTSYQKIDEISKLIKRVSNHDNPRVLAQKVDLIDEFSDFSIINEV